MKIEEILEDLYKLDPALRAEEAELKKVVEKLMESRPDGEPDGEFRERLKSELMSRFDEKKKRAGFFIVHRTAVIRAAGAAAALVLILTFVLQPGFLFEAGRPGQYEAEEQAVLDAAQPAEPAPRMEAPKKAYSLSEGAEAAVMAEPEADFHAGAMEYNTEEYSRIYENDFISPLEQPLSTFSIDVDTASYSNVRRMINSGYLPQPDAVRIEELINYFSYDYKQPEDGTPFSFTTELSFCPWNSESRLLHIGIQGVTVETADIPQTNLVFLVDTSGSMMDDNKLPLLKESLALLVDNLRPEDRVSIVAYAGSAGLVLPPTPGSRKDVILRAMERLEAGGSTAGGAGIDLAYKTAAENIFKNGNNRVVLATDGDFNVGQSSEGELTRMIEERRNQGVFLSVLGFGMGNYKDSRMESLADKGNGNYAYIDTISEARKVLVHELSSTLFTIAKDVKIQVEFNPSEVASYRLIGYENRVMAARDFNDDKKDAGEIGAGHSVTALYEIMPAGSGSVTDGAAEELRYQSTAEKDNASGSGELAFLKFRYKLPDGNDSILIETPLSAEALSQSEASDNFIFSSAVAEWGMILRDPEYKAAADIDSVIRRVKETLGRDEHGYRAGFLSLLYSTRELLESR